MFLGVEIYNEIAQGEKFKEVTPGEVDILRSKEFREIMRDLNIGMLDLPLLLIKIKSKLKSRISEVKMFDEVKETLHELKNSGYDLAIISSNSKENLDIFLGENELSDLFEFVLSVKNTFGKDKSLRKVMKDKGLSKDSTWYVGDEIRDIKASRKVGIEVIAVSWGFNTKDSLLRYDPDFMADNPKSIFNYFENK